MREQFWEVFVDEVVIPEASGAAVRLFACMSRFEFALKEAGYIAGQQGKPAKPDWTGFGQKAGKARAVQC